MPRSTRAAPAGSVRTALGVGLTAVGCVALLHGVGQRQQPDPTAGPAATEIGNARPVVLRYDGLMVRRCEALAVYLSAGTDGVPVRAALHAAADRAALPLTDLPPGVLSPATLDVQVPEVVGCLPAGSVAADARRVLPVPLAGEEHDTVQPVLVHDLAFGVRPARGVPADVATALDREGVLADVLGRYDVDVASVAGQLRILYTGPLLADDEVEAVRATLARAAGSPVSAVSVWPRSPSGHGVDLRTEPAPAAPSTTSPAPHHH